MCINATIDSTDDPFNVFEHVSNLYKANMTLTDFGNYTIFAFNGIGGMYKKTFIVIPQSKMLISNFIYLFIGTCNNAWITIFHVSFM